MRSEMVVTCQVFPLGGVGIMSVTSIENTVIMHNQTIGSIAQLLAGTDTSTNNTQFFHSGVFNHTEEAFAIDTCNGMTFTTEISLKRCFRSTQRSPRGHTCGHRIIGPKNKIVAIFRIQVNIVGQYKILVRTTGVYGIAIPFKPIACIDQVAEGGKSRGIVNREGVPISTLCLTYSRVKIPLLGTIVRLQIGHKTEVTFGGKSYCSAAHRGTRIGGCPQDVRYSSAKGNVAVHSIIAIGVAGCGQLYGECREPGSCCSSRGSETCKLRVETCCIGVSCAQDSCHCVGSH